MRAFKILPLLCLLPSASAIEHLKFQHWFPYYEYHWSAVAKSCTSQMTDYRTDNRTSCISPCACVVDCLLNNTTESIKTNIAAAQILLGLTPQILIFAGPSLGDIAVLSTYRPGLAAFLALGFPAMSLSSLFSTIDVDYILRRPVTRTGRAYHGWLSKQSRLVKSAMSWLLYAVAAGAIVNNGYTSIYTDLRTVSGWRCGAVYMPLSWSLSGVIPAGVAMIAIRTRRAGTTTMTNILSLRDVPGWILSDTVDGPATEIVFWLATFLTVLQMIYGIVVFSSLLFVSFLDACPILLRYGISASICHLLLLVELSAMRIDLETREGIRQGLGRRRSSC